MILSLGINAFSQEYHRFPTSNALWQHIVTQSMVPPHEWTIIDSLGQEIIIDSTVYTELYREEYIIGAIREDTIEKKIYFHNFGNEIILYDFTLEVGDTINYTTNLHYTLDYFKVVDSIDSVNVNGQFHRRWYLTNSLAGLTDIWIEGIGSVYRYGLLYPNDPDIVLDGSIPYFGCFSNDTIIYVNENSCDYSCPCESWIVKLFEEQPNKEHVDIFPIPFEDFIIIDLKQNLNEYTNVQIFTTDSRLIYTENINYHKSIYIGTSIFSSGLHIVKLSNDNCCELHKIIKK